MHAATFFPVSFIFVVVFELLGDRVDPFYIDSVPLLQVVFFLLSLLLLLLYYYYLGGPMVHASFLVAVRR